METQARSYYKRASMIAPEVSWLVKCSKLTLEEDQEIQENQTTNFLIENLEVKLNKLGTANNRKFEAEVKFIVDSINKEISADLDQREREKASKEFEQAHVRLGQLLGYKADNANRDSDPDPWWIVSDYLCVVFEDHSSGSQQTVLGSNKVRQAASHPNWIKDKIPLSPSAEIIPVLVTPCLQIKDEALPHTKNVCYWNLENFRQWTQKAITVIRNLRSSFPGEANIEWRKQAIQAYKDNEIDAESLVKYLKANLLKDLPKQ
jgi:hypothetical protein